MDRHQIYLINKILDDLTMKSETAIKSCFGFDKKASILNNRETNELISWLIKVQQEKTTPMRKKVIHQLCLMGMTTESGGIDFERQDNFIKNIGSRNPKRKSLPKMGYKMTLDILNQVDAMLKKDIEKKANQVK